MCFISEVPIRGNNNVRAEMPKRESSQIYIVKLGMKKVFESPQNKNILSEFFLKFLEIISRYLQSII